MDDDVPLAALAAKAPAPKTLKLDDDTPLSSLASRAAGPPTKKGAAGAVKKPPAPGGALKPKPKPGQKRRKGESSSSSSSSDSSSSSSAVAKRKAKATARKKAPANLKKRQTEENMDGDDEDKAANKIMKKSKRTPKEELVAQLLCRWWFATAYQKQDWPPQEESFYLGELSRRKLRKVSIQEWEWVPEEDDEGCHKVYELSQFRGVFRNSTGDLVDCRPQETCPCYKNFIEKDTGTLIDMLLSAYENQLTELHAKSKYAVEETTRAIKIEMVKLRDFQSKNSYNMNK